MSIEDRSPEFFDAMSDLLQVLLGPVNLEIITPWRETDKTAMVQAYLGMGGTKEELLGTWSCYKNGGRQCGDCPACIRRYIADLQDGGRR